MNNELHTDFCPECGGEMEFFNCGTERIKWSTIEWEEWRCIECKHIESNEPTDRVYENSY